MEKAGIPQGKTIGSLPETCCDLLAPAGMQVKYSWKRPLRNAGDIL